jgi:hypothetical protein
MKSIVNILFCLSIIFIIGCKDESVDYYDAYQDKLIIYSIIDSRNDLQLIKIQSNTPRVNSDNSKKLLTDLKVQVIQNNKTTYTLRDTVISGIDNYSVYYHPNFRFSTGNFLLMITSEKYPSCWASVNVPEKQKMTVSYGTSNAVITIPFNLTTKGYFYHFYLSYSVKNGAESMIKTVEVPTGFEVKDSKEVVPVYPDKILEENTGATGKVTIPYSNFTWIIDKIKNEYGSENVTLGNSWIALYSLDWNIYNYYHSVNGFKDPYSIRLDQTYWTNISGGYGIFGAIRSDSVDIIMR